MITRQKTMAIAATILGVGAAVAIGIKYYGQNPIVAHVGDYAIYQDDVACRDGVISLSYPDDKRKLGIKQLIQSYQYAQILKNHQNEITKEKIKAEKKRIDDSTLMPENLAKIKLACGGDGAAYENAFVLPVFSDRVIYYEFFLKDAGIQREFLDVAQAWRNQVAKTPDLFEALAKKENRTVSNFTVSLDRGLEWQMDARHKDSKTPALIDQSGKATPAAIRRHIDENQKEQTSTEGKKWIEEIIKPLSPGQVSPQVIDQSEVWLVVKYLKPSPGEKQSFELKAAVFPKRNYGDWLEAQKKLVSVSGITDG